jgi:histidinol-phosphatase (PHP family)
LAVEPVTWIRKDFHVHESHSSDAPGATVEKYCRVAERRGINEVAFTTHLIVAGPDIEHGISPHLIPEYIGEIYAAQDGTDVVLRVGLEVDYFPSEERMLEKILSEYNLDIVLGSLHYIRGIDIGSRRNSPRFFKGRAVEESLNIYYEGFRKAVESGLFDVMAHPDYFRKYLPLSRPKPVTWEEYGTTVYGAIDSLKSSGVGISINSSGYRHGINDAYPIRGFLEAAREAGVDRVTVGSDCHSVDGLGVNTVMALRRLKEAGYRYLCVYEDRKNRRVDLEDVKF